MNLAQKIEEIKQKPDHIRLRYVLLFTFVSIFIIFIFWIFSLKTMVFNGDLEGAESTCIKNKDGVCTNPETTTQEDFIQTLPTSLDNLMKEDLKTENTGDINNIENTGDASNTETTQN